VAVFDQIAAAWHEQTGVRRLAGGWLLLALLALGLSTVCALLLVVARIPLPDAVASAHLFRSSLVLHVGLAVLVWFLSCAAAVWTLAAGGEAGRWRWGALALSIAGVLAMCLAPFFGPATPVLSNYVPVLDSRLYLVGLACFFGGVLLCALTSISGLIHHFSQGAVAIWRLAAALSMGVMAVAFSAAVASYAAIGMPADPGGFELLAWGPGHVLQFVHVLLLMGVWVVLAEHVLDAPLAPRFWLIVLMLAAALPALGATVIYALHPVASWEFRAALTRLMSLGSWPAATLLAVLVLVRVFRSRSGNSIVAWPLCLSIVLFLSGCLVGAFIRSDTTVVPAHYHGTVGAVTLAYMTMGFRLLPAISGSKLHERLVRWQPLIYGAGLLILVAGLAWSGLLGVPRKTLHIDVIAEYPAYFLAMSLAGVGGFLAVTGAGLFVLNAMVRLRPVLRFSARALFGQPARAFSIGTLCLTVIIGVFSLMLPERGAATQVAGPAMPHGQLPRDELAQRFANGASLLAARQYQAAAGEFHRVLELAPRMPEAHVNMGFAMIGLQRYDIARDSFNVAIDLRPSQTNAYYGLAEALEGLHDLEGALGAMRSYVHLSKKDDAYLAKANAAIWEWEEQLGKKRQAAGDRVAVIPENGNGTIAYPIREKKIH